MNEKNTIQDELMSLGAELPYPAPNPYQVPVGYFENFANRLSDQIKPENDVQEELSSIAPFLNSISRKTPYSVPEGYFNSLSAEAQKDDEISTLLLELKSKNTYSVPERYFEQLPSTLLEKVNANTARVVPISQRKWVRYAAAAVITGIIAGSLVFKGNNIDSDKSSFVWIEKNTRKVSKEEISSLIELAKTDSTVALVKSTTKEDIKHLVKDIPDKEIQDLLNDAPIDELSADDDLFLN